MSSELCDDEAQKNCTSNKYSASSSTVSSHQKPAALSHPSSHLYSKKKAKRLAAHFTDALWNIWCVASVVGIWPRFIEPYHVSTTELELEIPNLPSALKGLKIVQFSDLHFNDEFPDFFLERISKKILALKADILVFTGDFISYSQFPEDHRLLHFLSKLSAPFGCYAILGNHDYSHFVSINDKGEYDCIEGTGIPIMKGFRRLFLPVPQLQKRTTERAYRLEAQQQLVEMLQQSPFRLLHNETVKVAVKGSYLNIAGLGEYMVAHFRPDVAFADYDRNYPGVVLTHNPDTFPMLQDYPGELLLAGHSHGGQIYLPWIWKKLTQMENMQFRSGLFHFPGKYAYVNRGLGGALKFRWFAPPELLSITLR